MLASLKSELRKIWSVRSTYLILLFAVVIIAFFAFYTEGIKAGESSSAIESPNKVANLFVNALTNLAPFGVLVAILLMTHEYRYNTIVYTLTSSKNRSRSLLGKIVAVSLFALFFTVFATAIAVGSMYLGLAIKGVSLVPQTFPLALLWQVLFVGWGFCMLGLMLATLIRQQVGAIAAFFLIPAMIEPLLGLLLKDDRIYLPFAAMTQVTLPGSYEHGLTPGKAALVVMVYLVVGWAVAWFLFLKRDAN
jgi:ABC-type transport system involved in multi-copper enzyme maturation permease subunit